MNDIKEDLLTIRESYNITDLYIEQSLQSFRSGFSSAKTLCPKKITDKNKKQIDL